MVSEASARRENSMRITAMIGTGLIRHTDREGENRADPLSHTAKVCPLRHRRITPFGWPSPEGRVIRRSRAKGNRRGTRKG